MADRKGRLYTLVFVFSEDVDGEGERLLLGMKKRGFGAGRWNGFGGKVEAGESARRGAARELLEESCVPVDEARLQLAGRLEFEFVGEPELMLVEVFVVRSRETDAAPAETEEMAPAWFPLTSLPFDRMWPDDKYWFPYLLAHRPFFGSFCFEGHDCILHYDLRDCHPGELAEPETDPQ
ncbi:oxidized purine nucleoside triphosphate hydrolase-like [Arctopsyche grandis]|uniref:oxidized purine nucleoside triphosphate hydrolase-like n=1 Tax=Arctopsyche grandis TaxID=121162 RepID=UPI00406D650A